MARRRRFVPQGPINASLEERIAPTSWSSIGSWFTSQYNNVKQDLGITHKSPAPASAGIEHLWSESATLSKPTHTVAHHVKVK